MKTKKTMTMMMMMMMMMLEAAGVQVHLESDSSFAAAEHLEWATAYACGQSLHLESEAQEQC